MVVVHLLERGGDRGDCVPSAFDQLGGIYPWLLLVLPIDVEFSLVGGCGGIWSLDELPYGFQGILDLVVGGVVVGLPVLVTLSFSRYVGLHG